MKRIVLALLACTTIALAQPSVNTGGILNVASYAPPGLPNASIAQGSLFAIFGTGLGPSTGVQVSSFPLTPDGFQGTAVSVTVAGKTLKAPVLFYFGDSGERDVAFGNAGWKRDAHCHL